MNESLTTLYFFRQYGFLMFQVVLFFLFYIMKVVSTVSKEANRNLSLSES